MFPDTFHTARLDFRPIALDDAGPIFDTYAQDPQVTCFLTWRPHRSLADTQIYIADCLARSRIVSRTYVLTERDDGTLRGAIDLRLIEPHRLEFGYVLARVCWGRGLMTEALNEVVHWALARPHIFRASSVCDVENIASARVMENAGLIREGLLRRWLVHPNISDAPRDCFIYGRTR